MAEALLNYKKNAGLDVDPASEAAAQEAYNRGMQLMQQVCRELIILQEFCKAGVILLDCNILNVVYPLARAQL